MLACYMLHDFSIKHHAQYEGNYLRKHGDGNEKYQYMFYMGMYNIHIMIIVIRIMETIKEVMRKIMKMIMVIMEKSCRIHDLI